jgi:hypothetical protein
MKTGRYLLTPLSLFGLWYGWNITNPIHFACRILLFLSIWKLEFVLQFEVLMQKYPNMIVIIYWVNFSSRSIKLPSTTAHVNPRALRE